MSDGRVFHSDTEKLQRLKPTVLFWSSALTGHLDLPTVGGHVLTLPKLERLLTGGTVRQVGGYICRPELTRRQSLNSFSNQEPM